MASKNKKNTGKKSTQKRNICEENLEKGIQLVSKHPLFHYLRGSIVLRDKEQLGKDCPALVDSFGSIYVNKDVFLSPEQWSYAIAHCLLHLAFGHFDAENIPGYEAAEHDTLRPHKPPFHKHLWNQACDIYIAKFLADIKFGKPLCPDSVQMFPGNLTDEKKIYEYLTQNNRLESDQRFGTANGTQPDMIGLEKPLTYDKSRNQKNPFVTTFAYALANSVSDVIHTAANSDSRKADTPATKAAKWFVDHYPLLGGLAASFNIIEDFRYCIQNEIQVAAIDVSLREIYINPTEKMSEQEWRFILAHEYLHAGLMHNERCQGRDRYLWNVACDYVINGWLKEMNLGEMPTTGLLYDETLNGMSAESIYDMLVLNLKKYKKLSTFCGYGKGDIIDSSASSFGQGNKGVTLDDFCRNALQQGLEYHQSHDRGFIPAGLIQEIKALSMPPIPWDVKLARWFDCYFPPLEKYHTYARPSRRQGATPDIPRPRYVSLELPADSRTFGVVVDTSGSMSAKQIGMALGSIASYAASHDVPFARVVFCDAAAYDAGYLSPEDIAGRVQVKGRGGTILQPGITLLEQAKDFPKDGPILIITDGFIEDHLVITHKHAYLLPKGNRLPFRARGEVFYFEK